MENNSPLETILNRIETSLNTIKLNQSVILDGLSILMEREINHRYILEIIYKHLGPAEDLCFQHLILHHFSIILIIIQIYLLHLLDQIII